MMDPLTSIPSNGVSIGDAFDRICDWLIKDWEELKGAIHVAEATLHQVQETAEGDRPFALNDLETEAAETDSERAYNEWCGAVDQVVTIFETNLADGKIIAYIPDLETRRVHSIDSSSWRGSVSSTPADIYVFHPDIDDYGSAALIFEDEFRTGFFYRDEFDAWFVSTFGCKPRAKAGRPKGYSFAIDDQPLVKEMKELIKSQKIAPWKAAGMVAPKARKLSGSETSVQRRLYDRYRSRK